MLVLMSSDSFTGRFSFFEATAAAVATIADRVILPP
jgi:hypothetical protein